MILQNRAVYKTHSREARAKKDWATGDTIRNRLKELGVVLEDRADGTIWKLG